MGLVANYGLHTSDMSGDLPVNAQCLPFGQIPHTTRLFNDYLAHSPQGQAYYPRSALFPEWMKDESSKVKLEPDRRQRVAQILERQNRNWSASPKTVEN